MSKAEASALIDRIEAAIDRIRNLDLGLKASLIAQLDQLRAYVAQ
jgi:hypothetical protein